MPDAFQTPLLGPLATPSAPPEGIDLGGANEVITRRADGNESKQWKQTRVPLRSDLHAELAWFAEGADPHARPDDSCGVLTGDGSLIFPKRLQSLHRSIVRPPFLGPQQKVTETTIDASIEMA